MRMLLIFAVAAALPLGGCGTVPGDASSSDPAVDAGRRLFARSCAGCHAAIPGAPSIDRAAAPVWTLAGRHTPESLQHAAGTAEAHRLAMPSIVLTTSEAGAVLAYARALAAADPATRRRLGAPTCIGTAC